MNNTLAQILSAFQALEAKLEKRIDAFEDRVEKRFESIESKITLFHDEFTNYVASDSLIIEAEINNFIYEYLKDAFKGYVIEPYHTQLKSISHPNSNTKFTDFDGLYRLSLIEDRQVVRKTYSNHAEEEQHMRQIEQDAQNLQSKMNWSNNADPSDLQKREADLVTARKPKAKEYIFVIVEAKRHLNKEQVEAKHQQLLSLRECIALSKSPSKELGRKFKKTCETHGLKGAREVHLILGSLMWDAHVEKKVKELQASDTNVHIAKPMKRFEMVGGRMGPGSVLAYDKKLT